MEEQKETVKVFVRKSGPYAKSIDINNLRKILERTHNRQQTATIKPEKILSANVDDSTETSIVSQISYPDKVKIQEDDEMIVSTMGDIERSVSGEQEDLEWTATTLTKHSDANKLQSKVVRISIEPGTKGQLVKIRSDSQGVEQNYIKDFQESPGNTVKTDYSCCFCEFSTKSDDGYRKHISIHLRNKALRCNMCPFSADKISSYNEHVKEAHSKNTSIKPIYSCSICNYEGFNIESLIKHRAATGHIDSSRPFHKCKICNYMDSNVHKLAQHIMSHSRDSTNCTLCNDPELDTGVHSSQCPEVVTPLKHNFEEELEQTPKRLFTCTLCDFQCEELLFLVEHIKAHAKYKMMETNDGEGLEEKEELPFCCTMCDYRCVRPSKLALHMKTHGPAAVFRCKSCDFESKDFAHFRAHRKIHVEKKNFTCFVCLMKFSRQDSLKMHMLCHSKTKPFACNICEFKCNTKTQLFLHLKSHTKKKTKVFFPCPLCPNKYSTSVSLRNHLKSHSSDGRPYQCDFCDYSCFTSELLRVHVQKHSKVNKFRCEVCAISYPTESMFKAHLKDHLVTDKSEVHTCEICHANFSTKFLLQKHMFIHSGKYPFVCSLCSATFSSYAAKTNHLIQVHGVKKNQTWRVGTRAMSLTAECLETAEDDDESRKEEAVKDKYGYLVENVCEESDSEDEDVHEGQHQLIGYPEMDAE